MIKIGNGLLPAITSFLGMIDRNLPAIEHFGTAIAHLVAPVVTVFFTGLDAILKVLFGPLKDVTLAVGGLTIALHRPRRADPVRLGHGSHRRAGRARRRRSSSTTSRSSTSSRPHGTR